MKKLAGRGLVPTILGWGVSELNSKTSPIPALRGLTGMLSMKARIWEEKLILMLAEGSLANIFLKEQEPGVGQDWRRRLQRYILGQETVEMWIPTLK